MQDLPALFVHLVDDLHHDVGAGLHRLVIGTFDVDLAFAVFDPEMRRLGGWWRHSLAMRAAAPACFLGAARAGRRRRWWSIGALTGIRRSRRRWGRLLGETGPRRDEQRDAGNDELFHVNDLAVRLRRRNGYWICWVAGRRK
ncbi:hypothetical protein AGR2A_Cc200037 [Agrobacterium genomosp. 2 str. CFBP 5494]|uniref:Uncharacterized protein n=1 Tax=Agrobacterium genomosp. 2 str. CFBP 5494 TaxID=1183436 RepID=A0A9W5B0Y9_9HYPH|nr:hypothetical protein AGR2A_Cc200037 [Agrobacterium genomosp. 2 str. CFBP 5494]